MKPVAIFRHTPGEGPGYFATFLDRHSIPWRLVEIDAGESVPHTPEAFSGFAFMGGPMSVNDDLPWIEQECALIRAAVVAGTPVIGHCLGGQLMAKALGGAVKRNRVWEIGWGEVQVAECAEAQAWFGAMPRFLSFHWHGETFSIPAQATPILSSPYCANQAFTLGKHLAMQCHVEMTEAMIRLWGKSWRKEFGGGTASLTVQTPEQMQTDIEARVAALNGVADKLYTRWIAGLRTG